MPPHHGNHVVALRCQRCGGPLELPPDPQLLHIDCVQCGQDNVLPPHLVQARQKQFAAQMARESAAHNAAARVAVEKTKSKVKLLIALVVVFGALATCGGLALLGWYSSREEEAAKRRADDPAVNGQTAMVALLETMKTKNGCERILVQPRPHRGDPKSEGLVSLKMVHNDHCVHVLATTGTNQPISVRHESEVALTKALPAAQPGVDYRLCAEKEASHKFFFNTTKGEPYTVAALECPRLPDEGGSRAKPEDAEATGKKRTQELLAWMNESGCKRVMSPPAVRRGKQSFTLTLNRRAGCFNMFVASHFKDMKFDIDLTDPDGKAMPVPRPAHEMRITHCAKSSGKFALSLTPSTNDYYSSVTVECPRNGPEGLKREREMVKAK